MDLSRGAPAGPAGARLTRKYRNAGSGLAAAALAAGALVIPGEAAAQTKMTAVYEGRLHVKLLDVRSDYILSPGSYRAGARATGAGAVNWIKPVNLLAQAQGRLQPGSAVPSRFTVWQGRKRRTTTYAGRKGADPLTGMLQIGLRQGGPCAGARLFDDGKQRYLLTFQPAGAGKLSARQRALALHSPARCRLSFTPLAGFKGQRGVGSVLTGGDSATFARSQATGTWVLTDITIGTIAGAARIELVGFTAQRTTPAPRPSR